jgi:hypothetical protein
MKNKFIMDGNYQKLGRVHELNEKDFDAINVGLDGLGRYQLFAIGNKHVKKRRDGC